MFEYPLSRAARLRPRKRAMSSQTGFVVLFGLMFFLSGGPATSIRPGKPDPAASVAATSNVAASAQEADRPVPPPLLRVLDEKLGGSSETSALWTMALRTDLALEPDSSETVVAAMPDTDVSLVLPPEAPIPEIEGVAPVPTRVEAPSPAPIRAEPARPDIASGLASISGRWIPDTGTCRIASDKTLLPLQLSALAAKAGSASCKFLETRGERNHWSIVAKCANGRDRWTANVRLVLANERLTWTSQRGSQAYRRCPTAKIAARR